MNMARLWDLTLQSSSKKESLSSVAQTANEAAGFHLPLIRLFDSGVEEQQKQSDYLAAPPPWVFIQLCEQAGGCRRRRDRAHDNIFIGHCRGV